MFVLHQAAKQKCKRPFCYLVYSTLYTKFTLNPNPYYVVVSASIWLINIYFFSTHHAISTVKAKNLKKTLLI